jgi:hypothetical protein
VGNKISDYRMIGVPTPKNRFAVFAEEAQILFSKKTR